MIKSFKIYIIEKHWHNEEKLNIEFKKQAVSEAQRLFGQAWIPEFDSWYPKTKLYLERESNSDLFLFDGDNWFTKMATMSSSWLRGKHNGTQLCPQQNKEFL